MKSRLATLGAVGLFGALIAAPAPLHALQAQQTQHDQHHPAATAPSDSTAPDKMKMDMMAADAKLEELVKKMNAARGAAKTDAMAELLTALVQNHRTMCGPMMANMTSMMHMTGKMRKMGEKSSAPAPADPQK
jgi:hypothetical protein